MEILVYGLPVLWGIILLAMIYFAIAGRKTQLGYLATLFLCGYVLAMIVLPAPWTVLAGPLIFLLTFTAPYWYIPTAFLVLLTAVSLFVIFGLKRNLGSLTALTSFIATTVLFYAGFSAYLIYEIPSAQVALKVETVCQSRKSAFTILTTGLRESGRPHAIVRTANKAYIYSFSERRFVEIPETIARNTPCNPINP